MRTQAFRAIGEHQKVNHFPGSFEIGRKDRLWRNLNRLQSRVGKNVRIEGGIFTGFNGGT